MDELYARKRKINNDFEILSPLNKDEQRFKNEIPVKFSREL